MLNDEVVDEVRAVRQAHAEKFGYDLRTIFEDLKKSERDRIAAGHPFVASSPPMLNTAFQRTRFAHS